MTCNRLCHLKPMVFTALVLSALILGCAGSASRAAVYVNDIEYLKTWYLYLHDGKTPKKEIERQLGNPSQQFENGRLWTFGMIGGQRADENPYHSLVLVFDDQGVLKQHRLMKVR